MTISNPSTIDLITEDPSLGLAILIMVEDEGWEDLDRRRRELQDKVNSYLTYALDGQLAEDYPDLAGKRIRIQLDSFTRPPRSISRLASQLDAACKPYGIEFLINEVKRPA